MSVAHQQALKWMDDGLSPAEVERELVASGTPPAQASAIVAELGDYAGAVANAQAVSGGGGGGGADVLVGAAFLVGGLVLTAVTFAAASGGGTYVLAWGPMLYGGIKLMKGLARA